MMGTVVHANFTFTSRQCFIGSGYIQAYSPWNGTLLMVVPPNGHYLNLYHFGVFPGGLQLDALQARALRDWLNVVVP